MNSTILQKVRSYEAEVASLKTEVRLRSTRLSSCILFGCLVVAITVKILVFFFYLAKENAFMIFSIMCRELLYLPYKMIYSVYKKIYSRN